MSVRTIGSHGGWRIELAEWSSKSELEAHLGDAMVLGDDHVGARYWSLDASKGGGGAAVASIGLVQQAFSVEPVVEQVDSEHVLVGVNTDVYCLDRESLAVHARQQFATPFREFLHAAASTFVVTEIGIHRLSGLHELAWSVERDVIDGVRIEDGHAVVTFDDGAQISLDLAHGAVREVR